MKNWKYILLLGVMAVSLLVVGCGNNEKDVFDTSKDASEIGELFQGGEESTIEETTTEEITTQKETLPPMNYEKCDNLKSAVANVFEGLRNAYAVSFVDTASGVNKYSKEVLNLADLVVICLPQTQYRIDKFFKDYDFKGSNVMYAIGNYDDRQKTKAFKIMMQYTVGKKCGQVLTLPNNPEYADSMNNREAIRYFLRNIECTQKDPNYHFIQSSTKIAKDILKRCKISSTVGGE